MSKRKPGADNFAIKQALQEQLGRTVDGKTRAQRIADALIKKAEKGQPGAVKEIQDRLLGKPAQQKQEGSLRISEETAARLATIAAKLTTKCAYCGKPVGGTSVEPFMPEQQPNTDSGFKAFEAPQKPRAAVQEPDAEKPQPLMRQIAQQMDVPVATLHRILGGLAVVYRNSRQQGGAL